MPEKAKCEICEKTVKKGEGITITTDGLETTGGTRMHQECFDEMWADFMELDKQENSPKVKKKKSTDEPWTTCDNCEKEIFIKDAIKVYCGCGCSDYFCNEKCQQEFRNKN